MFAIIKLRIKLFFTASTNRLTDRNQIIYFEDHADALRGERDLGGVDEQRLYDLLLPHVRDGAVAHVDAARRLALVVSVAQLRHHADGTDAGVLGQCVRDNLQSLRGDAIRN